LLFNRAYQGALTIKEIKEVCFYDDSEEKDIKTNHKKAKELHNELKRQKFITAKGILNYSQCKKILLEKLPTLHSKELLLKEIIENKHKLLTKNIDNRKEEIVQQLWINQIEEKMYNYEDGKVVAGNTTESFKAFKKLKDGLYASGIVSFRDAFELARSYVEKNKDIVKIMSERFRYLFVDEMQDTQQHQMDILTVFSDKVIKQYYGDPDQAIFNGSSESKMAWDYKKKSYSKLEITDSKRYGTAISQCIYPFRKEISKIVGMASWESHQPCILLYENPEDAIAMFHTEIQKRSLIEEVYYKNWSRESAPFNAVGFVGKKPESGNGKITIRLFGTNPPLTAG
jgi:hypothetical protein